MNLKEPPLKNLFQLIKLHKKKLKQMPANDKNAALAACFRSNRKDLNVEKK